MNRVLAFGGLALVLSLNVVISGCEVLAEAYEQQLATMRIEIEDLAADKSASVDSECGCVRYYIGMCQAVDLVYSRATVDESLLLEKVEEYSEFNEFVNRYMGYDALLGLCLMPMLPADAKVVNGVCTAVY